MEISEEDAKVLDPGQEPLAVDRPWKRANYLPAPHFYNLNIACITINAAFGDKHYGCYLVGSSLVKRDYRDVDIRLIMKDEEYDRLFKHQTDWLDALWSLMCTSISLWLSKQTDLPVDFQIQRQTQANAEHRGRRNAIGFMYDYPGELPSRLKL